MLDTVQSRQRKRNKECCPSCSVPEEAQHKAQESIQILLESVEAFQFAGTGGLAWPRQNWKDIDGKVMEHA